MRVAVGVRRRRWDAATLATVVEKLRSDLSDKLRNSARDNANIAHSTHSHSAHSNAALERLDVRLRVVKVSLLRHVC